MPRKTLPSMHDARDVEDKRLLEAGDHKLLLAGYFHAVRELCFLRLRDREAADEAAQTVLLRLLNELKRGKTYTVPFRVVVWKVVEWTVRGFYPGAKADDTLPDDWDPAAADEYEGVEDEYDFGRLVADLPSRQREVLDLIHRQGRRSRGRPPCRSPVRAGIVAAAARATTLPFPLVTGDNVTMADSDRSWLAPQTELATHGS